MDVDLKVESSKPQRIEMFNFKDKESQLVFKTLTSKTTKFSDIFETNNTLEDKVRTWKKTLDKFVKNLSTKFDSEKEN